jgi:P-type Cu+ transporter
MSVISHPSPPESITRTTCYHCGETCDGNIHHEERAFCCEGCRQVYLLLEENGMCAYYDLDKNPGIQAKGRFTNGRFDYLDDREVTAKLVRFSDGKQSHVRFHLPSMHCASCIWLLEHLPKIQQGIIQSRANFQRKEVLIIFDPNITGLRRIVELLAFIGYEPHISLQDEEKRTTQKSNRGQIHRIGVAGFCFGNIMMLSFPEYFSGGDIGAEGLEHVFEWLNLALALPVIGFSASEFFVSAWKGLRQRWLNIDAPIALAILVAFGRSVYEIGTQSGPGYLDSMSGIVFFMLIGRWFQQLTYDSFSFDRDYRSYFPLGVTRITEQGEEDIPVSRLVKNDRIRVRNQELVPADAVLLSPEAQIDYSFVSGENTPVPRRQGELVYAGARQCGPAIELEVIRPASGSHITELWNNEVFRHEKHTEKSFIHPWSRYFTYVLLLLALGAAIYWQINDPSKVWHVITSILIVACPCSLLLSATFTNGNMVRIFGRNKLYLKNASVIETLGKADTIVLDKTGTITHSRSSKLRYEGKETDAPQLGLIASLARHSSHPLSRLLFSELEKISDKPERMVTEFAEWPGKGVEGRIDASLVRLGSATFVEGAGDTPNAKDGPDGTRIYVSIDHQLMGSFHISNDYRNGLAEMAHELKRMEFGLYLLSGDNDREKDHLTNIFGSDMDMRFRTDPQEKLMQIRTLQSDGKKVIMLGDGLNDAGALRQSDVGIAVSDHTGMFSPASDAILQGEQVGKLASLLRFARKGKAIVTASFILSILYNIVGLGFAVQGDLSPLIAAILMPASSISIVIFVTIVSTFTARRLGLDA